MTFLTKRYSQILDDHPIQDNLSSKAALQLFFEAMVPSIWQRQHIIRMLLKDLLDNAPPLLSHIQKNTLYVILEILRAEELKQDESSEKKTKLEVTLEFMDMIGCDLTAIFQLLDITDCDNADLSCLKAKYPETCDYLASTDFSAPVHTKLVRLLFDRVPYIPRGIYQKIPDMLTYRQRRYFYSHLSCYEDEHPPMIRDSLEDILAEICRFSHIMAGDIHQLIEHTLSVNVVFYGAINERCTELLLAPEHIPQPTNVRYLYPAS